MGTLCLTMCDFYPRPPRGGRPLRVYSPDGRFDFYPRPPRGGRRTSAARWSASCKFLSTPSARRATLWQLPSRSFARNFYPRPPRGGRPLLAASCCAAFRISIHALREEGDVGGLGLPLRFCISIHALREEGDASLPPLCLPSVYFYPRPPRGGRPSFFSAATSTHQFLSTPSARRATLGGLATLGGSDISIHALREEGDADVLQQLGIHPISIHALREEGDTFSASITRFLTYFYPRPPRGGRLEAAGFGQPFF